MKTLLLVDGTGYLYRAYHALPDLRTSGGLPTGAVRGFVTMLRTLRAAVPCEHAACVFDAHGPTFRDELYPEYKAHRPPTPPDLVAQGPLVREAARALGWTVLEVSGVEADDVIATLAADARAQGAEVVIASGDKDLAQMVDEGTVLIDTMSRDGGPPRRSGCAEVKERFGVPPDRIVDYLALVGDTADNVPGVPKVGPKTAARWIEQYGSLDAIMARAGEIPGVVGENLRATLGWLPTGRVLVTVRRDVEAAREQARAHGLRLLAPDRARLADLYTRCEFRSWLRDLDEADRARGPRPARRRPGGPGAGTGAAARDPLRMHHPARAAGGMAGAPARGAAHGTGHRDHRPGSAQGFAGGHFALHRGRARLLHTPGARLSRSAGTAACRPGAGRLAPLAAGRGSPQGAAKRQVRPAYPGQCRHRAGGRAP
jgi:DNA polymerase-1